MGDGLEKLGQANMKKSKLNGESTLYNALDYANRIIRGVGSTIVDAASGAADAAGDAAKKVVRGFGVQQALAIGALALGGGYVLLQAMKSRG